ncbi:GTP 3',8-cyclase MoaA [bacterium]|nr:GTP 3',8-cyclase MoaA [bacterium]
MRCIYCMPPEGVKKLRHDQVLKYQEMIPIIEAAVSHGVFRVRITGGEPLVRKGIIDFVKSVSSIHGISDLSITTNGVFLAEFAKPLVNAGIKRVNISLDSLRPEKFQEITRGGDIKKVFQGINSAIEAGMNPVKINVVLIPGKNDDEIESFVRMAFEKPVQVRFIERMPFSKGEQLSGYVSQDEVRKRLVGKFNLIPTANPDGGPASVFSLSGGGAGIIGFISPRSHPFCASCTRLRLTSCGDLISCLDSREKINIRGFGISLIEEKIRELALKKGLLHKKCGFFENADHVSLSDIGG